MEHRNRLAFTTLGSPDWTFEQTVTRAKELGYGAIEIRGIGNEMQTARLPMFQPENRDATLETLHSHDIAICAVDTSVHFDTKDKCEASLLEGREALAVCDSFGIPGIRVFGDRLHPDTEPAAVTIKRICEGLRRLCDDAVEMGSAKIWLETHGDMNTIEVLTQILERLGGHPGFGILWDVMHSHRSYGNDVAAFYQTIKPYIRHIHVKDVSLIDGQWKNVLPGQGAVDMAAIVALLEAGGYEGYYSFEWERRWDTSLEAPEIAYPLYMEQMRKMLA